MHVTKEAKELLETIPEIMLSLARDTVNFSAKMTEAAVELTNAVRELETDPE